MENEDNNGMRKFIPPLGLNFLWKFCDSVRPKRAQQTEPTAVKVETYNCKVNNSKFPRIGEGLLRHTIERLMTAYSENKG